MTLFRRLLVACIVLAALGTACGSPAPTPTTSAPASTPSGIPGDPSPQATPTHVLPSTFDAADYFRGKSIRLVVNQAPGGGTDLQGRYIARQLTRLLPGSPRVIVSNVPPALAGANFVWASPADGLTVLLAAHSQISVSYDDRARFVATDWNWIGAYHDRGALWSVRGSLPYPDLESARGSSGPEITLGIEAGNPEDITSKELMVGFLAEVFDLPLRIYNVESAGTATQLLMLERGDVNSWVQGAGTWYSLPVLRPGWYGDRFLVPLVDLGDPDVQRFPNSEIPNTHPNAATLMPPEAQGIWEAFVAVETQIGKVMSLPPGTAPEIVAVWREAFVNLLADPQVNAELEQLVGQPLDTSMTGEWVTEKVKAGAHAYETHLIPILDDLQGRVFEKYVR